MARLETIPNLWQVKALRLINEDFIKKTTIGSNWSVVNIAVHFCLEAAANLTSTELRIGMCEGTVAGYGSSTCADFIGARIGNGATWTYAAGPPAYFSITSPAAHVSKQGTTITASTTSGATLYIPTWQGPRRGVIVVKITKGSPNYGMLMYGPTTSTMGQTDSTPATFILDSQLATPNSNVGAITVSTYNVAYSGAGNMDSVNISWSGAAPIYIAKIAVVRLS